MNEFDAFCSQLLEEAKRFYEKAREETSHEGIRAYQNACLLLTVCSLEAYINGLADEISLSPSLPIHVKGFLLEKDVRLEKGEYVLTTNLKMTRLIDKVEFLYRRHTQTPITQHDWWSDLKYGIELRNKLTHPKEQLVITNKSLGRIINAVLECLKALYKAIYKKNFPKHNLQLHSKLHF